MLSRYSQTRKGSNVAAGGDPSVPNNAGGGVSAGAAGAVSGERHRGLEEGFTELLARSVESLAQVGRGMALHVTAVRSSAYY